MKEYSASLAFRPVLIRFPNVRQLWLGELGKRSQKKSQKHHLRSLLGRKWYVWYKKLVKKLKKLWTKALKTALNLIMIASLAISLVWFGPKWYFAIFPPQQTNSAQSAESSDNQPSSLLAASQPQEAQKQEGELQGNFDLTINQQEIDARKATPTKTNFRPPYNKNLPEGDWLIIPRIGVRSLLQATKDYNEALETGVWLVPDFGQPGDQELPIIVAGHRFGFKWWWKNDYWRYHSFYLLPDLEPGDTVEIIADKRKYVYEIYFGEEGTEITDYQADLIIYTCKHLDSPIRIFRYARLIPTEENSLLNKL